MTHRLGTLRGLLVAAAMATTLVAARSWAVDTTELADPHLQARYLALTHELRCMQCQNETLADSPVELAADLRHQVRDLLLQGKSDDDVRAWMVARYGDFILFRPRFSLRTAWLWLAPGVALLIGAGVCWRIVRGRAALVDTDTDPVGEDAAQTRDARG
jgi:cytochrome c-type biogenesis protein CcmH